MDDLDLNGFETWLSSKLISITSDIDLEVYVSYIVGILENETTIDSRDSLLGILSGINCETSLDDHVTQIISKWMEVNETINCKSNAEKGIDLNVKMLDIINKQASQATFSKYHKTLDGHEKALILANYSHLSDEGEESDIEEYKETTISQTCSDSGDVLVKNMNALMVKERERDARHKAKLEALIKQQKDRDDRAKQKQKATDRKESEKRRTQKGEKRL